jgi:hypothetical protein
VAPADRHDQDGHDKRHREREIAENHAMRTRLISLLLVPMLVGCGSAGPAGTTRAVSATGGPAGPAASVAPSGLPTSPPSAAAPKSPAPTRSAEPTATPKPTAKSTPTPLPLYAAEKDLLTELRADSRIGCVPRRTGLPTGATVGVECLVGSDLVDRVGVYGFGPKHEAIDAYLARMRSAGIKLGSGDCPTGTPGDAHWPSYLPDMSSGGTGPSEHRIGCYRDGAGAANIRLTCYGDIYLGVFGKTSDIKALYAWTNRVAAGESTHRDPPGICARPD